MTATWLEPLDKSRAAFLLIALLCCAVTGALGCSVDEKANEHREFCKKDSECKSGKCYKGFCIKTEAGGSGSSGKGGSGGKEDGGVGLGGDGGTADGAVDGGGPVEPPPPLPDDKVGTACALDAGTTEPCYLGMDPRTAVRGVCKAGIRTCDCEGGAMMCDQHVWSDCFDQILPSREECNGLDDDCNGEKDDHVAAGGSCVIEGAKGVCAEGVDECDDGIAACRQVAEASAEVCDGKDNDCDGDVDEDADRPCYPANTAGCAAPMPGGSYSCKGLCAPGVEICDKTTGKYGACSAITPAAESCDRLNGSAVNEDCDDKTDEGCDCDDGMTYKCYDGTTGPNGTEGKGPCKAGSQLCTNNELGSCTGQVLPHDETCANDGADDNCDGQPDNVPRRTEGCHDLAKKGSCRDGTYECEGGDLKCMTPAPIDEVCDGLDNDCDGIVDNGFDLQTDPDHCGTCDTVCGMGMVCCAGHCADTSSDARYCGSCTNRCGAGGICCSGQCKNGNSDATNCKTCGNNCKLLGLLGACCSGVCQSLGCGG